MKAPRLALGLLPLALACGGDDGASGVNSLINTKEAPTTECPSGGVQVDTGLDSNRNGKLDADEVTATSYVCGGADGSDGTNGTTDGGSATGLTTEVTAADAADCPSGGKQVEFFDAAGDSTGDPLIICNAVANDYFGSAPVVRAYRSGGIIGVLAGEEFSARGPVEVLQASIAVPGRGTVLAFASSLAYCDTTGNAAFGTCYSAAPGTTLAYLTVVPTVTPIPTGNSNEATSQYLSPDVDNSLSVGASFEITNPGTYTYSVIGQASDLDHTTTSTGPVQSEVYYGNSDLTLIFIPH